MQSFLREKDFAHWRKNCERNYISQQSTFSLCFLSLYYYYYYYYHIQDETLLSTAHYQVMKITEKEKGKS